MTESTTHSIYCRYTSPKITEIVIDGDNAAEIYFDDKTFIKQVTLDAFQTLVSDYPPAEELTVTSNNCRSGWNYLSTDEIGGFLRRCTKVIILINVSYICPTTKTIILLHNFVPVGSFNWRIQP